MGKTPQPNTEPNEDRYLVPGLIRGLQVLGAFTPEQREMSLSDIARRLGLSRSAAFRSVYTLAQTGYLLQDARTQTYSLGPAVMRLGYGFLATRELVEIALPELERLRDEIDWSTHLGLRDGNRVLYMLRVPSRMGMGSIVHVGSRLPAASTTMGRVLLADLDAETLATLYRDNSHNPAPGHSQRGMADVLAQAGRDRESQTVTQIGNFESGIASVAAPVRDLSGRVIAAINATRAFSDTDVLDSSIATAVKTCARRISDQLGAAPA